MSWPRACTRSSRKACEGHHDWAFFLPTGPSPAELAVPRWFALDSVPQPSCSWVQRAPPGQEGHLAPQVMGHSLPGTVIRLQRSRHS